MGKKPWWVGQLTYMERLLIAPIQPIGRICRLTGGSSKLTSSFCFLDRSKEACDIQLLLPRLASEIEHLELVCERKGNTPKRHIVRRRLVQEVLEWNIINLPAYRVLGIKLCPNRLNLLPEHGNLEVRQMRVPEELEKNDALEVDKGPAAINSDDDAEKDDGQDGRQNKPARKKARKKSRKRNNRKPNPGRNKTRAAAAAAVAVSKPYLAPLYCSRLTLQEHEKAEHLLNIAQRHQNCTERIATHFKINTQGLRETSKQHYGINISYQVLNRLNDGEWLNDDLIQYCSRILLHESVRKGKTTTLSCFDPLKWHQIVHKGVDDVKHYLHKLKFASFEKRRDRFFDQFICFPININNSHWILLVIDTKKKEFVAYDSMTPSRTVRDKHMERLKLLQTWFTAACRHEWLVNEWLVKVKVPPPVAAWVQNYNDVRKWTLRIGQCPDQLNCYDCGIFALENIRCLLLGLHIQTLTPYNSNDNQTAKHLRRRYLLEINKRENTIDWGDVESTSRSNSQEDEDTSSADPTSSSDLKLCDEKEKQVEPDAKEGGIKEAEDTSSADPTSSTPTSILVGQMRRLRPGKSYRKGLKRPPYRNNCYMCFLLVLAYQPSFRTLAFKHVEDEPAAITVNSSFIDLFYSMVRDVTHGKAINVWQNHDWLWDKMVSYPLFVGDEGENVRLHQDSGEALRKMLDYMREVAVSATHVVVDESVQCIHCDYIYYLPTPDTSTIELCFPDTPSLTAITTASLLQKYLNPVIVEKTCSSTPEEGCIFREKNCNHRKTTEITETKEILIFTCNKEYGSIYQSVKVDVKINVPTSSGDKRYTLVGTIKHRGTAISGHYISYIKTGVNEWTEFNDDKASLATVHAACHPKGNDDDRRRNFYTSVMFYRLVHEENEGGNDSEDSDDSDSDTENSTVINVDLSPVIDLATPVKTYPPKKGYYLRVEQFDSSKKDFVVKVGQGLNKYGNIESNVVEKRMTAEEIQREWKIPKSGSNSESSESSSESSSDANDNDSLSTSTNIDAKIASILRTATATTPSKGNGVEDKIDEEDSYSGLLFSGRGASEATKELEKALKTHGLLPVQKEEEQTKIPKILYKWNEGTENLVYWDQQRFFFQACFPWLFWTYTDPVTKEQDVPSDWMSSRPRNRQLKFYEYCKYLMLVHPRFAADPALCFVLINIKNREASRGQTSFWLKQHGEEADKTIAQLRKTVKENSNPGDKNKLSHLTRQVTSFTSGVTGTQPYWWARSYELKAFVTHMLDHESQTPLWFHTGSCCEFYWRPMHKVLSKYFDLHKLTEYKEVCDYLRRGERPPKKLRTKLNHLLTHTPQVINQFFVNRTRDWMEIVMGEMDISDYWLRFEFAKSRGQIHFHSMLWSKIQSKLFHELFNTCRDKPNGTEMKDTLASVAANIDKQMEEQYGDKLNALHPAGRQRTFPNRDGTTWYKQRLAARENTDLKQTRHFFIGSDVEDDRNVGNIDAWKPPIGTKKTNSHALQRDNFAVPWVPEDSDAALGDAAFPGAENFGIESVGKTTTNRDAERSQQGVFDSPEEYKSLEWIEDDSGATTNQDAERSQHDVFDPPEHYKSLDWIENDSDAQIPLGRYSLAGMPTCEEEEAEAARKLMTSPSQPERDVGNVQSSSHRHGSIENAVCEGVGNDVQHSPHESSSQLHRDESIESSVREGDNLLLFSFLSSTKQDRECLSRIQHSVELQNRVLRHGCSAYCLMFKKANNKQDDNVDDKQPKKKKKGKSKLLLFILRR